MNLKNLYTTLVTGKEKALAGAVVAFVATFVLQHFGYHVSNGLEQTVISIVAAGLTHFAVYSQPNTK